MKFKQHPKFSRVKPLNVGVQERKPLVLGNERPKFLSDKEMLNISAHKGKKISSGGKV